MVSKFYLTYKPHACVVHNKHGDFDHYSCGENLIKMVIRSLCILSVPYIEWTERDSA
jgi:hypothetical protein